MPDVRETAADYFTARGLQPTAPQGLNTALRLVLDAMPTLLYGAPEEELTAEELAVLEAGGINLDTAIDRDPIAATVVQFAALLDSSLTIKAAAKRIGKPESHVRQMIARRTLYSILLDNRRYIPVFQFKQRGGLVANITKVNAALRPDLHPVEVFEWYTEPAPDLYVNDNIDQIVSPIAWLSSGRDYKTLVTLAKRL